MFQFDSKVDYVSKIIFVSHKWRSELATINFSLRTARNFSNKKERALIKVFGNKEIKHTFRCRICNYLSFHQTFCTWTNFQTSEDNKFEHLLVEDHLRLSRVKLKKEYAATLLQGLPYRVPPRNEPQREVFFVFRLTTSYRTTTLRSDN